MVPVNRRNRNQPAGWWRCIVLFWPSGILVKKKLLYMGAVGLPSIPLGVLGVSSFPHSPGFFATCFCRSLRAYLVLSPAAKRGNLRHRQYLPSTFHLASDRCSWYWREAVFSWHIWSAVETNQRNNPLVKHKTKHSKHFHQLSPHLSEW